MDLTMVILRLIHIFSAVVWAGYAFAAQLFIGPALQPMGPEGGKIMGMIAGSKNFKRIIPSVAGLTVLSGLILYYRLFGARPNMGSAPVLALSIGGLAGILAMVDGIRLGRKQEALEALSTEIVNGKPSREQLARLLARLTATRESIARSGALTAVLMVIALAGMTLSEYFAF